MKEETLDLKDICPHTAEVRVVATRRTTCGKLKQLVRCENCGHQWEREQPQ